MPVDLNSDVGESFGRWRLGDDAGMLQLVTSANVACGFHAGDPSTLRATSAAAAARGVVIGAQVSYRDLAGFGRRFVDVAPDELTDEVLYQLGALDAFAHVADSRVRYVKPHGALYSAVVDNVPQADAVVRAVREYDDTLPVLGLAGSALHRAASAAGLRTVSEVFADRAYRPDGALVSRREPGAVLDDPRLVAERVLRMVSEGRVEAVDGSQVALTAESVCVHGDSPGALSMARAVRRALDDRAVPVRPFVSR